MVFESSPGPLAGILGCIAEVEGAVGTSEIGSRGRVGSDFPALPGEAY